MTDINTMTDEELFWLASRITIFLGEGCKWETNRRRVRESITSVPKLKPGMQKASYKNRQFVSLITLVMYILHAARLNPTHAYHLMSVYRGILSHIDRGRHYGEPPPFASERAKKFWRRWGNDFWRIDGRMRPHRLLPRLKAVRTTSKLT
jgi:hypothetical protein